MRPTRPLTLPRPGADVRWWAAGDADAPVLVLLHGATLDHHAWSAQSDALADRYRTVCPDLRGHGSSTGRFDYAAAVDDVLALLGGVASPLRGA